MTVSVIKEPEKFHLTVIYQEEPKKSQRQSIYADKLKDAKRFAIQQFLDDRNDNPSIVRVEEETKP